MTAGPYLVTGATGFIGRILTARLVAEGHEVHAAVRASSGAIVGAVRHEVDLESEEDARRLVAMLRPNTIFHLGSLVTGRREADLVLPTLRANLLSTVNLLLASRTMSETRIVLAGSMEQPLRDEPPSSPYSASKAAASCYAQLFTALYGVQVVTARIFMVYGPGQRDRAKLVPASILAALRGERPRISDSQRKVDWIYVEDLVSGLLALATAPAAVGRTLDLGSGELASVIDIASEICRQCGVISGPQLGALPTRPLEAPRRADLDTTFEACGFRAKTRLPEGIGRTIAWMRRETGSGEVSR